MRRLLAALAFVAGAFSMPLAARADVQPVSFVGSLTAAGQNTTPMVLNGNSTCAITIASTGSPVGMTLVPVGSSDNGATYPTTIPSIGTGSITATGAYVGNAASYATYAVRFNLIALTSGTVNYTESCAPGVGTATATISGNVTVSNIPSPAPTNAAGTAVPVTGITDAAGNVGITPCNSSANCASILAYAADAQSSAFSLRTGAFLWGYNGSTGADRVRTTSATNPGILATSICDPSTAGRCVAVTAGGALTLTCSATNCTVTDSLPYNGTNGQTLATSSFVGAGLLDANAKFSPLQGDASQNLLVKVNAALPTGANTIGAVTGSGTFTVGGSTSLAPQTGAAPSTANGNVIAYPHCLYSTTAATPSTGQVVPCQIDSAGNLKVSVGSATITISGTVTANAGTGTFAVGGSTAVPGQAGAAAGSSNGNVIAYQLCTYNTTALTATTTNFYPCQLDASGNLKVTNTPTGTQTVSGTVTANAGTGQFNVTCTAANCPMNLAQVGGSAVALGQTTMASSIPVVLPSNQSAVPVGGSSSIAGQTGTAPSTANGNVIAYPHCLYSTTAVTGTTGNVYPCQMDSLGNIKVTNLPTGTQTIAGTVTANAGSGTFTVSGTVTANAGTGTFTVGGSSSVAGQGGASPSTANGNVISYPHCVYSTTAPTPATGNVVPCQIDSAGNLKVTVGSATITISGTVTANQGGTWTVQPGNTANTTAWKVDGSAVTQPVSGTVTANAGTGQFNITCTAANCPVNIAQVGGAALALGGAAAASSLPVVGTNDLRAAGTSVPTSGTTCPTNCVSIALNNAISVVAWQAVGLPATSASLLFEGSTDGGTTWVTMSRVNPIGTQGSAGITGDGIFRVNAAGYTNVRARVSVAGSGSVTVSYSASTAAALISTADNPSVFVSNSGTNAIPSRIQDASTTTQSSVNAFGTAGTNGLGVQGHPGAAAIPVSQSGQTVTELSAASGACTSVATVATRAYFVGYAASGPQTGTITLYNEGVSPTCAAGDVIYVMAARATPTGQIPFKDDIQVWASLGLAYKWTTAAEVGRVLLSSGP